MTCRSAICCWRRMPRESRALNSSPTSPAAPGRPQRAWSSAVWHVSSTDRSAATRSSSRRPAVDPEQPVNRPTSSPGSGSSTLALTHRTTAALPKHWYGKKVCRRSSDWTITARAACDARPPADGTMRRVAARGRCRRRGHAPACRRRCGRLQCDRRLRDRAASTPSSSIVGR
jgi:hypothetical protein